MIYLCRAAFLAGHRPTSVVFCPLAVGVLAVGITVADEHPILPTHHSLVRLEDVPVVLGKNIVAHGALGVLGMVSPVSSAQRSRNRTKSLITGEYSLLAARLCN